MLPLHLPLNPSRLLQICGCCSCAALSLCVFFLQPLWWQGLIVEVMLVSMTYFWLKRYALLNTGNAIVAITVTVTGWQIQLADGSQKNVTLLVGSRFQPTFVVLRMRCDIGKFWWCLLLVDSAPSAGLRRLRVIGRWRPALATC